MKRVAVVLMFVMAAALWSSAQTPACDQLSQNGKKLVQGVFENEYLYECCDDTISRCLQVETPCRLAIRLADNVCRRVEQGQDEARIRRALSRRARSMVGGGSRAEINLEQEFAAGPPDAPVVVVVYACARCPYCSKLVPALYEALEEGGSLHGRVQLVFRVFPIKGHEGSTIAGLSFVAAAELDAFWPFLLTSYEHFDDFEPELLGAWAEGAGIDRTAFESLLDDPKTRQALVLSKKEGLNNRVEETPTVFINGRRWVGDLEFDELLDVFGEEVERVGGELCAGH